MGEPASKLTERLLTEAQSAVDRGETYVPYLLREAASALEQADVAATEAAKCHVLACSDLETQQHAHWLFSEKPGEEPVYQEHLPPLPSLREAIQALLDRAHTAEAALELSKYTVANIRAQMEEARKRGEWPLSKVVTERDEARAKLEQAEKALRDVGEWMSAGDFTGWGIVLASIEQALAVLGGEREEP